MTAQTTTNISKVKVAAIQSPSIFGNVDANIKLFTQQITKAASNGAKIIVLPEAAITGYSSQDFRHSWCTKEKSQHLGHTFTGHNPNNTAQFKDGPIVQHFISLCKKLNIYLTVPYIEKLRNPNYIDENSNDLKQNDIASKPIMEDEDIEFLYYNSITFIDSDGKVCAHYRKTNLWPTYDNAWATQGDDIVTVHTEYGKIGLAICYDIHKVLPLYKEENIWSLLYCIAWVSQVGIYPDDTATFRWFNMLLPDRLKTLEIPYFVIGSNWSIDRKINRKGLKWTGYGFSSIYGPRGTIIKQSMREKRFGNDIVYADIPYQAQNIKLNQ